jgi:hypothetical protein
MARRPSQRKAQAAWDRLIALGGSGVWDGDMVIVSLADTAVTDGDLAVFRDFPFVQVLDLSRTAVTGAGLAHLAGATALEELIAIGTKLTKTAVSAFREAHPGVKVNTKPSTRSLASRSEPPGHAEPDAAPDPTRIGGFSWVIAT